MTDKVSNRLPSGVVRVEYRHVIVHVRHDDARRRRVDRDAGDASRTLATGACAAFAAETTTETRVVKRTSDVLIVSRVLERADRALHLTQIPHLHQPVRSSRTQQHVAAVIERRRRDAVQSRTSPHPRRVRLVRVPNRLLRRKIRRVLVFAHDPRRAARVEHQQPPVSSTGGEHVPIRRSRRQRLDARVVSFKPRAQHLCLDVEHRRRGIGARREHARVVARPRDVEHRVLVRRRRPTRAHRRRPRRVRHRHRSVLIPDGDERPARVGCGVESNREWTRITARRLREFDRRERRAHPTRRDVRARRRRRRARRLATTRRHGARE